MNSFILGLITCFNVICLILYVPILCKEVYDWAWCWYTKSTWPLISPVAGSALIVFTNTLCLLIPSK